MRARTTHWPGLLAILGAACAIVAASTPHPSARAASSSVNVTFNVSSVATLDSTQCQSGVAARTDFGTVQPGSAYVTGVACQLSFGSTNDTSQLRVWQSDRAGSAMWMPAWGERDASVGGGNGIVLEAYSAGGNDTYLDAELQRDGNLLAVGRQGSSANRTLVARYLPDGTRDPTFGAPNGYVFLTANTTAQAAYSVKQLADDSILVGAQSQNANPNYDMTVIKLDPAGVLVPGFGAGGRLVRSVAANDDQLFGLCVDESRNRGYAVGDNGPDIAVLAFDLTTGADVAAFGPVRTVHIAGADQARGDCIVDSSGNVVVPAYDTGGAGRAAVLRFRPDGTLDPVFDGPTGTGNGVALLDPDPAASAYESAWSVAFALDGDILVLGSIEPGGLGIRQELVARLDATTGAYDTSFGGGDGWHAYAATTGFSAYGTELQVLPDGRFYSAGGSPSAPLDAWVRRYRADGTPDPSFGSGDGQEQWDWELSAGAGADTRGITIGIDGSLWVVGEDNDGDDEAVVAKLKSLPVTDYGSVAGADWAGTDGFFGMCVESVSGTGSGMTAPWTAGACTQAAGTNWGAVRVTSGTAGAKVARLLTSGANDGIVQLRFGSRVPAAQRPGAYLAPLTFEVLAPDA